MDAAELTRRAFDEGPADPKARAHARARLDRAIAEERRQRSRRRAPVVRALLSAAALLLAVTIVLAVFGPSTQRSAAAAELHDLATIAASSKQLQPSDGRSLEVRIDELRVEGVAGLVGVDGFEVVSQLRVTTWIDADGSGTRRTEVVATSFPTDEDRAAWIQAGRPPIPSPGDVDVERFATTDDVSWWDLRALPTEPSELLSVLRTGDPIPSIPANDAEMCNLIGEILAQGDAAPALRSALFEAAARLDGVQLLGDVQDPLGRTGIGLAIEAGQERTELIVDGSSSDLLAVQRFEKGGADGAWVLRSWRALRSVELVNEQEVPT